MTLVKRLLSLLRITIHLVLYKLQHYPLCASHIESTFINGSTSYSHSSMCEAHRVHLWITEAFLKSDVKVTANVKLLCFNISSVVTRLMELMQHAWYFRRDHWFNNLAKTIRLPVPCSNVKQETLSLLVDSRTYVKVLFQRLFQCLYFR